MINRETFSRLRDEIIAEKGELSLFALFLREDADKWDVVVAAPWLEKDRAAALRYLSAKITQNLSEPELLELSRIVLLESENPAVEGLLSEVPVEQSISEIHDSTFAGLLIKQGLLFQAKRPEATPATTGA